MDEQLLIAGCKRGESWARKTIYEHYAPLMLAICMRYLNDRETARDLMQDGFLKIFTRIDSYAGTGSFEGWMKRVVVTTVLEHIRSRDALRFSLSLTDYEEQTQEIDPDVISRLSAEELMTCIASLPPGYRTVFNLFALEGYSHKEIADLLGIQEGTSKSQFVRAKSLLQKKVQSLLNHRHGRSE